MNIIIHVRKGNFVFVNNYLSILNGDNNIARSFLRLFETASAPISVPNFTNLTVHSLKRMLQTMLKESS